MSRGGRGAFRGGGRMKVGGQEVPWDYDPDLNLDIAPDETFPPIDLPETAAPTEDETRQLAHHLRFRARMHDDPLYAVLGDDMKISKSHLTKGARFDPFDGMPTWGKKYSHRRRRVPNFRAREVALQFFPRELWEVLDARAQPVARARAEAEGRLVGEEDDDGGTKQNLEDIGDEEDEAVEEEKHESDEEEQEEQEEDFSEDDDEMAGDYNAEGYFDTGEGDDDGFGGGADDGGDGGMYE